MTTPVWLNDPRILLRKDKIMEIWPNQDMSAEEKVNAVSRLVIILVIIGFTLLVISGAEWFDNLDKTFDDMKQDRLDWKQYLGISLISLGVILFIIGIFMCIFK